MITQASTKNFEMFEELELALHTQNPMGNHYGKIFSFYYITLIPTTRGPRCRLLW